MTYRKMTVQEKCVAWNIVAGVINAAEAVILLMVVTRTSGMEEAGMLTIAFSVGNLMMSIGKFGMLNYQVTDIRDAYSFDTYYASRLVTVGAMAMATLLYLAYGAARMRYPPKKLWIILVICGIYMVESVENVFWGFYQRHGRLDLGGKTFSFRWLLQLSVTVVLLLTGVELVWALPAGGVCGGIFAWLYNRWAFASLEGTKGSPAAPSRIRDLLRACLPLFLMTFFSNFIVNSPKYAIDALWDETTQANYGFIAMPVFVVSLASSFIYQPLLLRSAYLWDKRELTQLKRIIAALLAAIVGLTLCSLVGAYFLGIPVLSLLYHADLRPYRAELLILLLGGGFLALEVLAVALLTVMRVQSRAIYAYGVVFAVAVLFAGAAVRAGGITGAALLYTLLEVLLSSILFGMVLVYFHREEEREKV